MQVVLTKLHIYTLILTLRKYYFLIHILVLTMGFRVSKFALKF